MTKKRRVIFLDLLRALAVVMMVMGHTVDALLLDEYRSYDYAGFKAWQFARGMTAPIFMLTAGTVFVYLLRSTTLPFRDNPRVAKGVKRALLLLAVGYLLRFPSSSIIGVFSAPAEQWRAFWAVDALHLIGVGIFLLLSVVYLSEKLRLNELAVFGVSGLFFFVCAPFSEQIIWNERLPTPIAAYCYSGSGSLFPLFPWAGYVMIGGLLGAYLARDGQEFAPSKLNRKLMLAGTTLVALYYYVGSLKDAGYGPAYLWTYSHELTLLRLGSVFLLMVPVTFISAKVRAVPQTLLAVGRRTLPIYVTHLVILYGSPWSHGLNRIFYRSLSPWPSIFAALLMLILMIGLALIYSKVAGDKLNARETPQPHCAEPPVPPSGNQLSTQNQVGR
ncbi:MAG TPA: heparan-alpha-glucosaminide N-acetyltransferase domain-containing protein [Blastocatellia bacterium]